MNSLNLPNPKMMDVAVPANMRVGLAQEELARRGCTVLPEDAARLLDSGDVLLVDLRESAEQAKHGVIPGSVHSPYADLQKSLAPGGMLHQLAKANGSRIMFCCAYGERSAMAVRAAQEIGLTSACHIKGGLHEWKKVGAPIVRLESGLTFVAS
jgi:rhodanese-related sulfurtransferase